MIWPGSRSLQVRLAVRVAALYTCATALVIVILMSRAYDTARSLGDRDLSVRTADLAKAVSAAPNGAPRLDLSPRLTASYDAASDSDVFAIRRPGGGIVAASPPGFGELVMGWPDASDRPNHFRIKDFGPKSQDYYGLSVRQDSIIGPLSIWVARSATADDLMYSLLRKFIHDVMWAISLLIVITLAIGFFAIRGGLRPIREVSEKASAIGPGATFIRLPDQNLPSEIKPLVVAMNRALDRLEQGFAVQRQFTANAAHELRTPLAIITAALESIDGKTELTKLKADVARMNRLVEQLLRVARLDTITLDVSETIDIREIAAGIVASMAPWALAQGRTIAFEAPEQAVKVRGNANAIEDAIRNLVENAINHSPRGREVNVSVDHEGTVRVSDHGPGVPAEDRARIFERFWRGKASETQGAGLGLAIVHEIMKAHKGCVQVDETRGGGATFALTFPRDAGAGTC
jgi:two-component system, OmpR family, sensor histidine kinase TctE